MKVVKRFLSAALVIIIAGIFCLPAYAFQTETVPVIVVSGMAVMPLSVSDEQGNLSRAYPPETDKLLKTVGKVIVPAACLINNGDWEAFADKAFPAVNELFDPIACDNDGNSVYDISYPTFELSMDNYDFYTLQDKDEQAIIHASVDKFGAKNVFFFNYDWRLDPLEHADMLKDFIESVKEQKDCSKVTLAPCSMGGTVVLAYLQKYGESSIYNCVFFSTAFQGTSVVGELFRRELYFDKDALILRINQLGRDSFTKAVYPLLTNALDEIKLFNLVISVIDRLIENVGVRFYDEVLCCSFGHMPGLWALVADKDYEAAKESMLDADVNEKLIERIDYYHYNVQQKAREILNDAIDGGSIVSIVSQYNMQGLPVNVSYKNNNDFLIDTTYSSGGAICADLNNTLGSLGSEYVQQNTSCGHNHISPDNVIDASTGLYPEQTWFIKNLAHIDFPYGTQAADFAVWLLGANKQYNISSNLLYPQFMNFDYDTGKLTQVSSDDSKQIIIEKTKRNESTQVDSLDIVTSVKSQKSEPIIQQSFTKNTPIMNVNQLKNENIRNPQIKNMLTIPLTAIAASCAAAVTTKKKDN
jgi:pimeloyl-ACP methyl ester carboxylesterase